MVPLAAAAAQYATTCAARAHVRALGHAVGHECQQQTQTCEAKAAHTAMRGWMRLL